MANLKFLVSYCASLLFILNPIQSDEPKLHQLNVIFRHGDRMPEIFPHRFPNDPNMHEVFQPMGSGGLTNAGKRRMYRLGELLRGRYGDLLGSEPDEARLYGLSSSVSRTKMSLQLVLASLYPPSLSSRTCWHPNLDWQPIPAHYYDFRHDKFFNRDKCQIFIEEYGRVYNSSEIQKKLKEYKPFLDDLKITVGKGSQVTLDDILILHNNLDVERRLNMKMMPWMIELLQDERLKKMRMLYYEIAGYNEKLRRLQAGFLIRKMNEDMIKASQNRSGYNGRVSLYSGHDKNLICLFQSLNIYDSHLPEFGSALIFELLSQNEKFFVKILYYLGIPAEIKTITLPGCVSMCPFDQYLNLTKSAEILDDEVNCKINSDSYFGENN